MSISFPGRATRAAVRCCAAVLLSFWVAFAAPASEIRETDDFREVAKVVSRYAEQHEPENVLLVLDIDNTLLAMDRDLGSDQWFEWQKYLLENDRGSRYLVADDFDGLLEAQGLLFDLGKMHPTQPDLPRLIGRLQGMGARTLVLTSRGPEFRVATERELRRAGYEFGDSALALRDLPGGEFLPYDLADLASDGLKQADVAAFGLTEPRPVSYDDGIFMAAGQPKGAMLLTMLHHASEEVEAVVYGDDNIRHVAHIYASVSGRGLPITAVHYTREDTNVKRFEYSDKEKVQRQWRALNRLLEDVLGP